MFSLRLIQGCCQVSCTVNLEPRLSRSDLPERPPGTTATRVKTWFFERFPQSCNLGLFAPSSQELGRLAKFAFRQDFDRPAIRPTAVCSNS